MSLVEIENHVLILGIWEGSLRKDEIAKLGLRGYYRINVVGSADGENWFCEVKPHDKLKHSTR